MCELIPDAALNPGTLQPLLEALVSGLAAEPRVAANVCWAFSSLAENAYEAADILGKWLCCFIVTKKPIKILKKSNLLVCKIIVHIFNNVGCQLSS